MFNKKTKQKEQHLKVEDKRTQEMYKRRSTDIEDSIS